MADPLSITASIIAVVTLGSTVLNYLREVKDEPQERVRLRNDLRSAWLALSVLKERLKESDKDPSSLSSIHLLGGENGPIDQFKRLLERLSKKLTPKDGKMRKFSRAVAWPFESQEVKDILSALDRLRSMFQLAIGNDSLTLIQDIREDTSNIPSLTQDIADISQSFGALQASEPVSERRSIIRWFSPLSFFKTHDDHYAKVVKETGQWFLVSDPFNAWLSSNNGILWCPGIVGAGKTMLLSEDLHCHVGLLEAHKNRSIAVEHTVKTQEGRPKDEIGIAYVYCNYKEQDTQRPENLLASVWRQLIDDQADLGDSIRRQYSTHVDKGTRPKLKEIADELRKETDRFQKVYVFIDALDELTDEQTRETFIDQFQAFSNICLMVTSRYFESLARLFKNAAILEIAAHATDVQRYVTGRIAQGGRLSRHIKADATLEKAIGDSVVKNADKMFLLAQLHMDSLVLQVSQKAVRQALDTLPKGLDATYDEAMSRIDEQGEQDTRLAGQVLSWISFAVRPLELAELREALSIELEAPELDNSAAPDDELITSVCAGLVVIDPKSEVVRLCHYSAEEYLKRSRAVRFPTAQTDIAQACLTYLMFHEFKQGPIKDEYKALQHIIDHRLLAYASTNWGKHLQGPPEEKLQQMTLQFLSGDDGRMAHSVQIASWLDYFYRGCSQKYPKNVIGLHLAADFGLEIILETLLKQGADVGAKDSNGENALHKAAKGGHKAPVQILLGRGLDVMTEDSFGWTALHKAATSGSDEVVLVLLQAGATISKGVDGRTALHFAAEFGSEEIASVLLGEGADVSATANPTFGDSWDRKFNAGRTPLHWAASNGYDGLIKLLSGRGANIDARNSTLRTPLQEALMWGHVPAVEALLECGASVQYADNEGWTPLHEAAWRSPARATQLLLDRGADVDSLTNHPQGSIPGPYSESDEVLQGHNTPLHLAAICDNLDAVKILLNKGADLYKYDQKGLMALHMAVIGRSISVIEFLLDNENCRVPVDIKAAENGDTALHKAAARGYEECVCLLLDRGADLAEQTSR
ncbi:MAG: hypothetical protein Q9191_001102 [Dirinaria sp. TL-2023a]